MAEIDLLKRAKLYLDKLANGIDPITNLPVSDTDCINQLKVSRCLFYVSGVLEKLINAPNNHTIYYNGENNDNNNKDIILAKTKIEKSRFTITPDELKKFCYSSTPTTMSVITKNINDLVDLNKMIRLRTQNISLFLKDNGLIIEKFNENNTKSLNPTEQGQKIGISRELRHGQNGSYYVLLFDLSAQKYIINNIYTIIEYNKLDIELNRKHWSKEHDEILADLFKQNVPILEIAITLKRSTSATYKRLKKLGLIKNT